LLHGLTQCQFLFRCASAEDTQITVNHGLIRRTVSDDQVFNPYDACFARRQCCADVCDAKLVYFQCESTKISRVEMGGVFQRNLWHDGSLKMGCRPIARRAP